MSKKEARNEEIRKMRASGMTYDYISEVFGISRQAVYSLCSGIKKLETSKKSEFEKEIGNVCSVCGSNNNVSLHRKKGTTELEINNFSMVCKKCHKESILTDKSCSRCLAIVKVVKKKVNGYKKVCAECFAELKSKKKWSRDYDKCIVCGTSERKHRSKGMCMSCYSKKRYSSNPALKVYYATKTKEWREKNPERFREILQRAVKRYRGKKMAEIKNSNPGATYYSILTDAQKEKMKEYNKKRYSQLSPEQKLALSRRRKKCVSKKIDN